MILIRLICEMEQLEFENIVKRLRPKLKNKAQSMLHDEYSAEDIVQDTLLKLWSMRHKLEKYRSIEALALVVAQRLCLDYMKRKRFEPYNGEESVETEQTPHDEYVASEEVQYVDDILAQLPDKQSAILRMKHIDYLETNEIAKILGISEGAVRITLMRARNKVKEMFINKLK